MVETQEIKASLSMPELLARDGVELRKSNQQMVGLCPFHQEQTPSFTVWSDHAHCYGCGWHGDVFKYWQDRHGCDFAEARRAIVDLARFPVAKRSRSKVAAVSQSSIMKKQKPALPVLRQLDDAAIAALAQLRGLSEDGIRLAISHRRLFVCDWPNWRKDSVPAWVVTDDSRNVAQFRRMDGAPYQHSEDRQIKAWTKGSPTWPIGATMARSKGQKCDRKILLVEGGPDMLAAYHFLMALWLDKKGRLTRVPDYHVVAMLGASCSIREDALECFKRKKVRIIIHNDAADAKSGKVPSFEAAARWTEQLCAAGSVVETFSLADISDPTHPELKVKDLNDLARCSPEVWHAPEIRAAFFDFDF